jgi:4-amino-4-deoxy-L-arabinose transferase-like glycosyltransferase
LNNDLTILHKVQKLPESSGGLLFVLLTSLFLKCAILIITYDNPFNPDGILYIAAAKQLSVGHFKEALALYPMPFYPFLIALVHSFIPSWEMAGRLLSLMSMVLATIPLYLLTRDLFSRKAAFWGTLAFALVPVVNEWSVEVLRGPPYILFAAWAVFFAVRSFQVKTINYFIPAAVFSCFPFLCRFEGFIFIPLYFFFLILLTIIRPTERRCYLKGVSVCLVLFLLIGVLSFAVFKTEESSFNRLDQLAEEISILSEFKFLNNYHLLYEQLKVLEDTSPYPNGKQNFAEITRHYMFVIYWFGIIESYIKIIFPLFIIPLLWGVKHKLSVTRVYLLVLVIFYLLMIYYSLVERDFIQKRFLFAAVFFSYPWIGLGMERFFLLIKNHPKSRLIGYILAVVFIMAPLCGTAASFKKQDNRMKEAGKWLAGNIRLKNAGIISTDSRVLFYAGRDCYIEPEKECKYFIKQDHDYSDIEQIAMSGGYDIIIFRTSVKRKHLIPEIKYYKKIKSFSGKKNIVLFYCSPDFVKTSN